MIEFSILDYMGKYTMENIYGIFVLLSLKYEDSFSEAVCFYNDVAIDITIDPDLELKLKSKIEDYPGYMDLLFRLNKSLVPYNELVNRIDNVNFSSYKLLSEEIDNSEVEEIDPNEIKRMDLE